MIGLIFTDISEDRIACMCRAKQGLAGNDPPYTVAYGQELKFGGMLDLEDESIKIFRNVGNFTRGHGAINRNTSLFNSITETLAQPRCLPGPCPAMPCPALPSPAMLCPALPCPAPALPCPVLPLPCPVSHHNVYGVYCYSTVTVT